MFENTALVAALVDRLTFKSYVLDMNGDSYRLEQTLKTQRS
jgi:DNA replication protein DnaC